MHAHHGCWHDRETAACDPLELKACNQKHPKANTMPLFWQLTPADNLWHMSATYFALQAAMASYLEGQRSALDGVQISLTQVLLVIHILPEQAALV